RMQTLGLQPLATTGGAMLIGAAILTAGPIAAGLPLAPDTSPRYLAALDYLAVPGSVIGFTPYLTLIGRLGPERAAKC
ncbi:EamA family transporter, partial [Burkholderia pseudomallei]